MRVINGRAGNYLYAMAEGETFELDGAHWIISDYIDNDDKTLCVRLESGRAEFIPKELIVVPVTVEAHIL